MEEIADVQMPARKRSRVEAPDHEATPGPSELKDDFEDIYGTPSMTEEETTGGAPLPTSAELNVLSSGSQKPASLPTLPDLPGLGVSSNGVGPAAGVAPSETQDITHAEVQRAVSAAKLANEGTGKAETPGEVDDREKQERLVLELGPGNSEIGDAREAVEAFQQTEREQGSREEVLPTMLDGPEDVASKVVSEIIESAAVEAPMMEIANVPADKYESVKTPSGNLPGQASTRSPTIEMSVQDPLAFLEASLPPAARSEAESETLKHEDTTNQTEADGVPMTGVSASEDLVTNNRHDMEAEFEIDSSPLNSDSDISDDSSSSSSSDDGEDYEMLDPAEQARRLMAEDGGSDEEGGGGKGKASGPLRTQNEKPDEDVPKPDVVVTEDMKVEELGSVEGTVENLVLIKAKTSGEYQVLEQGSVLCLEDRSVIGVIAETLGRVQQPYYSVRFTNAAAILEAGLAKDTKIFYVEQFSTPVFTHSLKAFKGSDASNLHDEEIGEDELEFSDDEAEAEYKRRVKMQRQQKRMGRDGQNEGFSSGPRGGRGGSSRGGGRGRGGYSQNGFAGAPGLQEHAPNPADGGLNYDDVGNDMKVDTEDLYTPLARPTNLHEMPHSPAIAMENPGSQWGGDRGGHGRGRRRGDRRGGGGRGFGRGRGQGNGGFENGNRGAHHRPPNDFQPSSSSPNSLPPWPSPLQQGSGFGIPPLAPPHQPYQYPETMPPAQTQPEPHSHPHSPFQSQHPPPPHQWNQPPPQAFSYLPPQQQQYSPNTQHHAYQPQQDHHQQQQLPSYPSPGFPPGAHINPTFFTQTQNHNHLQQQQWPPPQPPAGR